MAGTGTVGILRALLTADASAYQKTMKQSADATKTFGTSVAGLGTTAGKVTPQLTRLEKSFQGDKLLYTANNLTRAITNIGGASKLTDREMEKVNRTLTEALGKYRALGQTAPKAMRDLEQATRRTEQAAGGLSMKMVAIGSAIGSFVGSLAARGVSSIVSMGLSAFTTAGQIDDLSKRLDISTDAVQDFQFIAGQTGTTVDVFARAMNSLAITLAKGPGGKGGTADLLREIGLEFKALRAMNLEQQFFAVTDALAKFPDDARATFIGTQLMRRGFVELKPAMVDGMKDIAEGHRKWTKEQVEQLAKSEDEWKAFWDSIVYYSGIGLSKMRGIFDDLRTAWDNSKGDMFGFLKEDPLQTETRVRQESMQRAEEERQRRRKEARRKDARDAAVLAAEEAEATAERLRQLEALRDGYQRLGIVTRTTVNDALKELGAIQRQAVKDGADADRALAAQLPHLKELVDKAKASGVNVEALTTAYLKAGDAWRTTIDPLFDQVRGIEGLADATKHLNDEAQRLGEITLPNLSRLTGGLIGGPGLVRSQDVSAPQERILTFWNSEFPETVKDALDSMTRSMSTSLTDMLVGLRGFKDGFLDIWRSIRAAFSDILASMLNDFLSGFLRQMLSAMAGRALAGTALGSALGIGTAAAGAGTAAAVGGAAAVGAAPAAASAAGAAGIASLGWTVGAPTAGAGIGATLAALATNPFTIAGAGALVLGLGIAKKGWFRGGEEGAKVNPARDAFLKQFGGFDSLAAMLTSVTGEPGGGRLFTLLRTADTMKEFTAASTAITTLLQRRGVPSGSGPMVAPGYRGLSDPFPALAAMAGSPPVGATLPAASVPAAARSGAAPVTMNVTVQAWDRSDLNDAFREEIIPRLKDALQLNQAGLTTAIRQVG